MKAKLFIFILCLSLGACISAKKKQEAIEKITMANNPNSNTNNQTAQTPVITEVILRRMLCHHRVLEDGDSLKIFLELDIPRLANKNGIENLTSEFQFSYGLLASYTSKEFIETRRLNIPAKRFQKIGSFYYTYFKVEKRPIITAIVQLEVVDLNQNQRVTETIPLTYTITKLRERFGLFDKSGRIPVFSNYILATDTIQIRDVQSSNKNLIVRHYNHQFEPASPPMAINKKNLSKHLGVDSVYNIATNQPLQFSKPGVYFLQDDTTAFYGLCFYVSERKFPKLSKVNDLIDPLIYITTEEELKQLQEAGAIKKEMDKFWLKLMSGNVKSAKFTIREYYRRVKETNRMFTSFKEGWKTDMGMIFIIYGAPNTVIRSNDAEYWFYRQIAGFSEIKFTFMRRPNQFTDEYYELSRFPEYEQVWYPFIELWRDGKIQ
jgi:GWxTD domain-containing protein